MSLINKMLQDLDARGSQGGEPMQGDVRPVTRSESRLPLPVLLVSALGALSLAAGGYFALRFYQQRQVVAPAPVTTAAKAPAVAPVAAPIAAAAPALDPKPAAPAETAPVAAAPVEQAIAPAQAPEVAPKAAQAVTPQRRAPAQPRQVPAARESQAAPATASVSEVRARADNEYRRALASLAEGRVSDSIDMLEHALRLDPSHDGARQTMVGLLIEKGRHDDAMRHLQAALAIDARQPSMAILLARLQIERGGDGIDTLMRSLPAGAGKPEYHAFLAGALARVQRHGEAAEQYIAALRAVPNNAVWLMGLGVALQGEGRDADALAAYQRASAAGTLSAPLQAFVERKINQLAR